MLIILWVRCSREPERKGQIHLRDQFKENVFFQSVPELLEWTEIFCREGNSFQQWCHASEGYRGSSLKDTAHPKS